MVRYLDSLFSYSLFECVCVCVWVWIIWCILGNSFWIDSTVKGIELKLMSLVLEL